MEELRQEPFPTQRFNRTVPFARRVLEMLTHPPLLTGVRNVQPSVLLQPNSGYTDQERASIRKSLGRESDILAEAILNQTGLKVEIEETQQD